MATLRTAVPLRERLRPHQERAWLFAGVLLGAAGMLALVQLGWDNLASLAALAVVLAAAAALGAGLRRAAPEPLSDERSAEHGPYTGCRVGELAVAESIGAGGVGHVYRAHSSSGEAVAIKIMTKPAILDAAASQRFLREVEALRQVRSPHVVTVSSWGLTDDGHHYLAMELLEGRDLRTFLGRGNRLSLSATLKLVEEVAAGLEAAHRVGIVHRDIKPSNLFLARAGRRERWKVLDFGLSKIYGVHASVTRGHAVGTPGFMSPEQTLGEPLDRRSDVFALAAVAYAALTGVTPFGAADPVALTYQVIHGQPRAPRDLVELPEDVALVLAWGMAKSVSERPPSAVQLAVALREACSDRLRADIRRAAQRVLARHPWRQAESDSVTSAGEATATDTVPMLPVRRVSGMQRQRLASS